MATTAKPRAFQPGDLVEQWTKQITAWSGGQIIPGLARHEDDTLTYYAIDQAGEDVQNFIFNTMHTQIEMSHMREPLAEEPAARKMFGEIKGRPSSPIVETIFAIDMFSKPDQGIEFKDFLGVFHWEKGAEWRHGVLDYRIEPKPSIFRSIKWNHFLWSARLRRGHQLWAQKERKLLLGLKIGFKDGSTEYAIPGFEGLRVPTGRGPEWDVWPDEDKGGGRIYAMSESKFKEVKDYIDYVNRAQDGFPPYWSAILEKVISGQRRWEIGFRCREGVKFGNHTADNS